MEGRNATVRTSIKPATRQRWLALCDIDLSGNGEVEINDSGAGAAAFSAVGIQALWTRFANLDSHK